MNLSYRLTKIKIVKMRFLSSHRRGSSGLEYGVLIALITLAVLSAMIFTSDQMQNLLKISEKQEVDQISGIVLGAAPSLSWHGADITLDGTPPQRLPISGETTFILTNTGNQDVSHLGKISVSGSGWSLVSTTCTSILVQGTSCEVRVRLETWTPGNLTGVLKIDGGPSVSLWGFAFGFAAAWAFDPTPSGVFSADSQAISNSQTFLLRNVGTLAAIPPPLSISGPDAEYFSITEDTCGLESILPDAACEVTITFTGVSHPTENEKMAILSAGNVFRVLFGR